VLTASLFRYFYIAVQHNQDDDGIFFMEVRCEAKFLPAGTRSCLEVLRLSYVRCFTNVLCRVILLSWSNGAPLNKVCSRYQPIMVVARKISMSTCVCNMCVCVLTQLGLAVLH
jgi:hypothetical protein